MTAESHKIGAHPASHFLGCANLTIAQLVDCHGICVPGVLLHAHLGRCPLEHTKGLHDWLRHALTRTTNLEVLQGPLRLGTPVPAPCVHVLGGSGCPSASQGDWIRTGSTLLAAPACCRGCTPQKQTATATQQHSAKTQLYLSAGTSNEPIVSFSTLTLVDRALAPTQHNQHKVWPMPGRTTCWQNSPTCLREGRQQAVHGQRMPCKQHRGLHVLLCPSGAAVAAVAVP